MESSVPVYNIRIEEPNQYSIPQECPISECFYINICYTHEVRPSQSHSINSEMPTTASFNQTFWVPSNILCDCDEFEILDPDSITITYLHETFSSVPISSELLDSILLRLGECARDMMEHNYDGRHILEMDVMVVHLTTRPSEDDEDIDNQHASMAALVNSLEKVRIDNDASSCSTELCAICLEEFCSGSESKLVRTKCFHYFHEDCIVQWLQHCNTNQSYSCPLCRCQIPC